MSVAGVVLAGGRSSRMRGPDKAVAELGGRPLALHCLQRLGAQVDAVALNSNTSGEHFPDYTVINDQVLDYAGPVAGISAGVRWARELGSDWCVTAAVDTPFFPQNLVQRLLERRGADIVLASSNGRSHPTFAAWSVDLDEALDLFLRTDTKRRVMDFILSRRHALVDFPSLKTSRGALDPFFNVNSPEDLEKAAIFAEALD